MGLVALALAFVAGLLTALSPCVLPLLPLVMGSAARSRYGPLALAMGFVGGFLPAARAARLAIVDALRAA